MMFSTLFKKGLFLNLSLAFNVAMAAQYLPMALTLKPTITSTTLTFDQPSIEIYYGSKLLKVNRFSNKEDRDKKLKALQEQISEARWQSRLVEITHEKINWGLGGEHSWIELGAQNERALALFHKYNSKLKECAGLERAVVLNQEIQTRDVERYEEENAKLARSKMGFLKTSADDQLKVMQLIQQQEARVKALQADYDKAVEHIPSVIAQIQAKIKTCKADLQSLLDSSESAPEAVEESGEGH